MIIKKLKLENIRSYKDQAIEFPLGKTLFEGDIGSGKSTILMAIEFGLFGLGSEKAGSLLRIGENEGSVVVIFESGGKEYTIQRNLVKRRNSIGQDNCVLKTPESTRSYSATEIKERVLEILNFNEPADPKAQSVIYRYAIYTPQEEMKVILNLKPDLRLQTLRKAFRIEDYKTAAENAKDLSSEIRARSKELAGFASDLPDLKSKKSQLESTIAQKNSELVLLRNQLKDKQESLKNLEVKIVELRKSQLLLREDAGKAGALIALLKEKEREISEGEKRVRDSREKISKLEPRISELESIIDPTEKTERELQKEIQELEAEQKKLLLQGSHIKTKFDDYKSILESGVCPTCDRKIEAHDFSEKVEHQQSVLLNADKKTKDCEARLGQTKQILDQKREFNQAQAKLTDLRGNMAEYKENINTWSGIIKAAGAAAEKARIDLASVNASNQKLERIESSLREAEMTYEAINKVQQNMASAITSGEASITRWEDQTGEYTQSIKSKEKQREKSEKLNEYLIWTQDYFSPTLEIVEKQVMIGINQEFNSQFQKWFSMLVEDPGKQARVDEDFTPVIQQDGLDQEVTYLSGGEKTSVALAYRLALNTIVRRVSTGMQTNLMILDEPTDGFSKEQLSKVREILDEIQSPQIILVSHERELESFADQIYRVAKKNGISEIT
ncbi:MAG: AAA family ATPase [Nitrososphaerales archaeon]